VTRSSRLFLMLALSTIVPALVSRATDSQPLPRLPIDETGTVHVPAFEIPLSSYMSDPAKQAFIKAAASNSSGDDWKSLSIAKLRALDESELQTYVDRARVLYPVNIDERRSAGVRTRWVTPKDGVAPQNRDRVLINVHGGGFFSGAGNDALIESIPVASLGQLKVVTVDYREGPEYSYPSASEDTALVYGELLKEYKPANVGIYGCSAGGILTAMATAWFQKHQLPAPGAIGIFGAGAFGAWYGPPSVLGSWSGDSAYTAPLLTGKKPVPVDPRQASPMPDYMSAYLRRVDLADPLVSPALSSEILSKFPPTLLITGTRAWDMSAAAQTQRALTTARVEAHLHLWDGMGHCFFFDVDLPESREAFAVITQFFNSHLGRAATTEAERR
jgi:monoterpene epsilon-lactone hydrolase